MHVKEIINLPGLPSPLPFLLSGYNKFSAKFRLQFGFSRIPDGKLHMNTIEQRMNMFHLTRSAIAAQVPGEFIEFGTYTGQSAVIFQKVLDRMSPGKLLWTYDMFGEDYGNIGNIEQAFVSHVQKSGVSMPKLVRGNFYDTVPAQLPDKIAFVHLDCGSGKPGDELKLLLQFLLEQIYPRLSKGAIVLMMDYHDRENTVQGMEINPGVKAACDAFLAGKPEEVTTLYGNQYSHAFFEKK